MNANGTALRRRIGRIGGSVATAAMLLLAIPLTPTATESDAAVRPAGQSDRPAAASGSRLIVENVHTDAVSAYLDGDELVLASKADYDADGDGVVDLGTRIDPATTAYHLDAAAAVTIPEGANYAFLGEAGEQIWLAPQTQDHDLIWPGFSTEDPGLEGRVEGDRLSVRLTGVEGPGGVEIFTQADEGPERRFSSVDDLDAWTIGVPQHTHMNWAFEKQGIYTLTFEETGVVAGREQTATNEYVFIVGDLEEQKADVAVSLTADRTQTVAGGAVLLTAEVAADGASQPDGVVQFRDAVAGTVLGHTPVVDGTAAFLADALAPGDHGIVAEFIPSWSDLAHGASSEQVAVSVAGEAAEHPGADDTDPVSDEALAEATAGAGVRVRNAGAEAAAGGVLALEVTDPAADAAQWVSVWTHAPGAVWGGFKLTDLDGALTVDIGADVAPGEYSVVLKNAAGDLIGWDVFSVGAPHETERPAGTDPDDTADGSGPGGGSGDGDSPSSSTAPSTDGSTSGDDAAAQSCVAEVTLDTGHIDAFNVSAAGGKAVLQIKEDVTGSEVIREAETVLLRVKEEAYRTDIPAGSPGAPAGYVLPLTQDANLIWPGWDTNRTAASGFDDVTINITNVDGPGTVSLYSQGSFGDVSTVLEGGSTTLPGSIREATPAHTHAQWVFSEKGIYKLTASAVATNPDTGEQLTTASHVYVFQVGDVELGDALCGQQATSADIGDEVQKAVEEAEQEAAAAQQTEAEKKSKLTPTATPSAASGVDGTGSGTAAQADALADAGMPMVIGAAIGAGGMLAIAGIAGTVTWYLRRLRTA